ncbi:hypothetical protein ACOGST_004014 [Vibrio alginolyticus]|nr:hypothetical protein [Vibrio alginolyticus]ELB2803886.1 hypothetical protein [Vibrio alginolyticus]ELB2842455.1 hypothetical protein [Vibrio alginolyticus]ELB2860804.1 hypothetical protein [Vibrio alginolyticus]ELU8567288.1 hypothetical protein [Vibrio alginolyticus]
MSDSQLHGIKISFDTNVGNPSRVFHSMGGLIDGLNEAQQVVLDSINLEMTISSSLKRTIEGSCICVEEKTLFFKQPNQEIEIKKGFLDTLSDIFIDWFGDPDTSEIDSPEPIDELAKNAEKCISKFINTTKTAPFNVSHISRYNLAKAIEKISNSLALLDNNDTVYFDHSLYSESPKQLINKNKVFARTVDELFSNMIQHTQNGVIVEICNIDLNKNTWKFRWKQRGVSKAQFNAEIRHTEWLAEWYSRNIDIRPGDSLKVDITSFKGKVGKKKPCVISKVHSIVRATPKKEQISLDSALLISRGRLNTSSVPLHLKSSNKDLSSKGRSKRNYTTLQLVKTLEEIAKDKDFIEYCVRRFNMTHKRAMSLRVDYLKRKENFEVDLPYNTEICRKSLLKDE